MDELSSYAVAAAGGVLACAWLLSRESGRRSHALLALALVAAGLGTLAAFDGRYAVAAVALTAAVLAAALGELRRPRAAPPEEPTHGTGPDLRIPRAEVAVIVGVVALAAGLRFINLAGFPSFVHGEENVWTWQVATTLFSDERPWPTWWYSQGVPTSYWQEWPFFKLFGLNYTAPRYSVAFFGTLAVGMTYFLARGIAGTRAAIIAGVLAATSTVALAASRGAFVQSHVHFWSVLAPFLYFFAVERRSRLLFVLAGGALALGLLTYQTFLPMLSVVGLHFGYVALSERQRWREHALNGLAMSAPVLLVWPRASRYLESQRSHVTGPDGSLTQIEPPVWSSPGEYVSTIWGNIELLLHEVFVQQSIGDYLIIRPAPIFLLGVTALALVGVGLLIPRLRERWPPFLLLWLFIPLSFSPVVLGAPYVRALLPAYPAGMIVAAVALVSITPPSAELRRRPMRLAGNAAVGLTVAVLAFAGAWAYFTEIKTTSDGERRAELAELIDRYAPHGAVIVLPYVSFMGDFADTERESIRFVVAGSTGGFASADEHYVITPYEQTLTAMQAHGGRESDAVIVVRHYVPEEPDGATPVREALARCYPQTEWRAQKHFSVAFVEGIGESRCTAVAEALTQMRETDSGELELVWSAPARGRPYSIALERSPAGVHLYEMEDLPVPAGWGVEAKFARDYSGGGYLFDHGYATEGTIAFPVDEAGTYTLWLRTYRRAREGSQIRLSVDGSGMVGVANPATAELNTWVWERFGPYTLAEGENRLDLVRRGPGPALFIDAMVVASTDFDPNAEDLWLVVFEDTAASDANAWTLPRDLPPGSYRWRVIAGGGGVVDGLGEPLASEWHHFEIDG